jgi:hypothetical protein
MNTSRRESGNLAKLYVIKKLNSRGYKIIEIQNMTLTVKSPNGVVFALKIASLSKPNAWIVPISKNRQIYYILVLKPENCQVTFFIFTSSEMHKEVEKHISLMKRPLNEYSNPELEKKGLSFKQAFKYENKWDSLPK